MDRSRPINSKDYNKENDYYFQSSALDIKGTKCEHFDKITKAWNYFVSYFWNNQSAYLFQDEFFEMDYQNMAVIILDSANNRDESLTIGVLTFANKLRPLISGKNIDLYASYDYEYDGKIFDMPPLQLFYELINVFKYTSVRKILHDELRKEGLSYIAFT